MNFPEDPFKFKGGKKGKKKGELGKWCCINRVRNVFPSGSIQVQSRQEKQEEG